MIQQADIVAKSIALAKKLHAGQYRNSGEEYVHHCLRVMTRIAQYTSDPEVIAAAVLHDIHEDTDLALPDISAEFSPRVSFLVGALSKNKKNTTGEHYDPSFRIQVFVNRFAKGCLSDPWIMFIKMADQIDNSQTFDVFSREKQQRKIREITDIFFPLYKKIYLHLSPSEQEVYHTLMLEIEKNIAPYIQEELTQSQKNTE